MTRPDKASSTSMTQPLFQQTRRDFLRDTAIVAGSMALPSIAFAKEQKPGQERVLDFRRGLPEGLSFQRDSSATLVSGKRSAAGPGSERLRTVAVAAPRFLGEQPDYVGLLVEGATQNRIRNSAALTPKSFALSKGGDALPAVNEKGPDGSGGVIRLRRGGRGAGSIADLWAAPAADGDFCTASVWLRSTSGSGTWRLRLIDFTTYNTNSLVVDVGPEWQRYAVTLTLQMRDVGARRFAVAVSEPALKEGEVADARTPLTDVLMWGPQLESGADASSYVPTGNTIASRQPDLVQMPSAWLPASGGITFHLPQGGRRSAVLLDTKGEHEGLLLQYSNSGWLTARVGDVEIAGFGDRTADTWVRLEWSDAGAQILSGKSGSALTVQASSRKNPGRLDFDERARLGMDEHGNRPLNRALALVKISDSTTPVAPAALQASLPALVPNGYRASFVDDFTDTNVARINENATGGKPGAPAWRSRYRHERKATINAEKQIYVDRDYAADGPEPFGIQPFSIANSVLTIRAEPTPPDFIPALYNKRYTSGCITTELTHWQTYGYFEMRARLPRGKGFWPAFWMLPKRDTWPPEIDILEASGARPRGVHVGFIDKSMKYGRETGAWIDGEIDIADGFHVYALEWTRDKLVHLVDGKAVLQIGPHGIHEDMYMLANLALGSKDANWIPDPDSSTPFPGKLEIDYIRAFSRS